MSSGPALAGEVESVAMPPMGHGRFVFATRSIRPPWPQWSGRVGHGKAVINAACGQANGLAARGTAFAQPAPGGELVPEA